jgi:acyl-CoA synthetase (AMP-forming)/AMP-acid ligase II
MPFSFSFFFLQNYGSTETGNIALERIGEKGAVVRGLVPWGALELLPPRGGALLPPGAQGEIATAVPWASEGYVRDECLVRHASGQGGGERSGGRTGGEGGPLVRTGDAGRWGHEEAAHAKDRTIMLMQRLRPPIEVHRALPGSPYPSSNIGALPAAKLRLLVQPFEVEEALLRVNPTATAAAALQGPHGQLFCAVASPLAPMALSSMAGWPVQPDALRHVRELPTSPAGKILYSEILKFFE